MVATERPRKKGTRKAYSCRPDVGPPPPPPQKASQRRFLLALTGQRRPVGTTLVLHCRSLRKRVTARIKGGHVHSLSRLLRHLGQPNFKPDGTPTGPKKGGGECYELTFVQFPPSQSLPFIALDIFIRLSIIHRATTSLFLCFLLQALTPRCARAFTAFEGELSHKKTRKDVGVKPTLHGGSMCTGLCPNHIISPAHTRDLTSAVLTAHEKY